MMSPENITALLSSGLAVGLIVVGVLFFTGALWPWWTERDAEERQRRYEIAIREQNVDEAIAANVALIARTLNKPIVVEVTEKGV